MENFKINVPIKNTVEDSEELLENENPTVINVDSITVPAFKKEFYYSESIRKETSIEGYERFKISWGALYDYIKSSVTEMPEVDNEEDKKELITIMSKFPCLTLFFDYIKQHGLFNNAQGYYFTNIFDSCVEDVDKVLRKIDSYSKIINTDVKASIIVQEIKELHNNLKKESDELLEFRKLCLKSEEFRRNKVVSDDYYTQYRMILDRLNELNKTLPELDTLARIDSCIESLSLIINPIQEKVGDALTSLLSTWSDGEFPKLTLNHVLSANYYSPEQQERREQHKEKLFKDDVFLQKIRTYSFDLADGYFWNNTVPLSAPSFGFAPNDKTLVNITDSLGGETAEFIRDPNAKQWLSQVSKPRFPEESGYRNWYMSSRSKESPPIHPSLGMIGDNPSHPPLRWGHAKYAIIPTKKSFNLIKLEHINEE